MDLASATFLAVTCNCGIMAEVRGDKGSGVQDGFSRLSYIKLNYEGPDLLHPLSLLVLSSPIYFLL